jgi:hypothetical protein
MHPVITQAIAADRAQELHAHAAAAGHARHLRRGHAWRFTRFTRGGRRRIGHERKIRKPPAVPAHRRGQRGELAVVQAAVTTMMPYDTYRLHQIERTKSPRELRYTDQREAQLVSAVSWLFRAVTQIARRPYPPVPNGSSSLTAPAACRGTMAGAMDGP